MKKHNRYYAEYCVYGVNTICESDTLMIFDTKEERDEMVERLNILHYDSVAGVARAITRKDAASLYRLQDIGTEYEREVAHVRTCAGRNFFEVGSKRGGALI